MAKIKPFKGYRYNEEKINDLSSVMAPPYDFISKHKGMEYYEMNPFNSIRMVSSKDIDETGGDPYERASKFLNATIEQNVLVQEKEECIYLYEQKVMLNNEPFSSRGFVTLLEITDYEKGVVVPCEKPSTNSKQDRFNMLKAVEANGNMISIKYIDKGRKLDAIITDIAETEPIMDFETVDGINHRLWKISDKETLSEIVELFKDKLMYIVDGHNRYEACCEYKKYMHEKEGEGEKPYDYTLAVLTESQDDGMVQQPVHRLVKFPKGFKEEFVVAGVQEHFKIEKIIVDPLDESIAETMKKQIATQRKEIKIALYCGGDYFYRLTFKNDGAMEEFLPDASDVYRSLDLSVLNKLILEDVCNVGEDDSDNRISYTTNVEEGVFAVNKKEYGCMFVVNPVRKHQMNDITLSGELLPKRSLCVFPKPATGVVIYKF